MATKDAAERVRLLGQLDLGASLEVLTGETLWSIQKRIATAVSVPRAKVAVPSCNASGKSWLAARLALAFYNAYTPGTPCVVCDPTGKKGGCRGSKVITTSSKETHLRDNLWGEIRAAHPKVAARGINMPGKLYDGDLRIVDNESNHYIVGQSSATAEGMQGAHSAHKLIIGDEATSVTDDVQLAITRLLASGDSRILLIYNPTTPDTYASKMSRAVSFETIRITAWDTPNLSGEVAPEGSNLITPVFLQELKDQGMGPGTFEWETSIEAKDWDTGDDVLIPSGVYDKATGWQAELGQGTRQLGVDISSYGSDESVIAVRDGAQLVELKAFPSMLVQDFVRGPVTNAVMKWQPDVVVFDGDGVGAGAVGYFEELKAFMHPSATVIGFRGGKGVESRFTNMRSAWWWALRNRFFNRGIFIAVKDDTLARQMADIHYRVVPNGDIRIETKQEMRIRGTGSPDRADAVMYAFALSDELAASKPKRETIADMYDLPDHSDAAMWEALRNRRNERNVNAVLGVPD